MTGIETAAAIAAIASAAVGTAATISSAQQQAAAGKYNAALADRSAKIAEMNAAETVAQGNAEAARERDNARRRLASVTAAQGASGADISSGSPLEAYADLAGEAAYDQELIRWRSRMQARGMGEQAAGFKAQAGLDRSMAKATGQAGYLSGGATLLGGLARAGGSRA